MNKFLVLAGACAICAITPAAAAPGNNDHGKSSSAPDKGHGPDGQGDNGKQARPGQQARDGKASPQSDRAGNGNDHKAGNGSGRNEIRNAAREQNVRENGNKRQEVQQVRHEQKAPDRKPQQAAPRPAVRADGGDRRMQPARKWAKPDEARRFYATYDQERNRAPASFCPPGLARKNNGCQAPGQVRKLYQRDDRWGRYMGYEPRYRSADWSYYNGYACPSSEHLAQFAA